MSHFTFTASLLVAFAWTKALHDIVPRRFSLAPHGVNFGAFKFSVFGAF